VKVECRKPIPSRISPWPRPSRAASAVKLPCLQQLAKSPKRISRPGPGRFPPTRPGQTRSVSFNSGSSRAVR
jgi:hypothetical protein